MAAAAAAAAATVASLPTTTLALSFPPPPFAPPGHGDPAAVADTEASHGHLADLLAGVLLLREGGLKGAVDALPGLHDLAKANILALEALKSGPKGALEEWEGLTPTQAAAVVKGKAAGAVAAAKAAANATKLAGEALKLVPGALGPDKEAWVGLTPVQAAAAVKEEAGGEWNASAAHFRAKVGNLTDPLWEAGVRLENKLGGKHELNKTDAWVEKLAAKVPTDEEKAGLAAEVKAKLEAFNVHFSDKMIEKPSKFRNFAALVMKHVTGAMLFDYAVDFNPW